MFRGCSLRLEKRSVFSGSRRLYLVFAGDRLLYRGMERAAFSYIDLSLNSIEDVSSLADFRVSKLSQDIYSIIEQIYSVRVLK